jgi:predicted transcriptional regulator
MKNKSIKKTVAGVVLDSDVIDYLDKLGEREDRSRSWLINTIVREYAQRFGKTKTKLSTRK